MKIEISNIKGYFPDGYSEQKYIDSSIYRVRGNGNDIVILKTPIKHKVKNDATYRNRKIQSVFYDKYILNLIITESTNIDLLSIAETVTITLDSGEIHNAELLDVPIYETIQDSDFKKVTLEYRDLNSKRTINHLEVNDLTDGIAKFTNGVTSYFSPLYCKFDVSEFEREENNDNGLTIVSKENAFQTIVFYAYLTDDQIVSLKKYTTYSNIDNTQIEFDGTTYTALEVPKIEVNEGDYEGLKEVIITARYEQILNYPFITQETVEITISANPTTLNFSYNDTETLISQITTNGESGWNIKSYLATWINAFKNGDNLEISVDETTEARTATIYVVSVDDPTKEASIYISQSGTSEIELSSNSLYWDKILTFPSKKTVVVTSTDPAGWQIESVSESWITAIKDGNNLNVDITNSTTLRTGTVTVSNITNSDQKAILTIYQGYTPRGL